jgi:2,3-bisphosphoglycerate-dependent phosphoglycerate mutase
MTSASQSKTGQLHLLFIRHGETQDNIDRVLQGQRDTSLTPTGHLDAKILADKLRGQHIDMIYHSPLTRMVETIQPILSHLPDVPTEADPELMGQALGELEGGSYDSIDMSNPRSADSQPGVELFDDFVRRLKRVFARIIGAEAQRIDVKNRIVIIATHGVGITSLFKALEATPSCEGFNPRLATRGPEAFEVRWTDSDDVARLVVAKPAELPIKDNELDWSAISGQPFLIELWGKKEKAL